MLIDLGPFGIEPLTFLQVFFSVAFSAEVAQFLHIVRTLDYKEKPDYDALRKVLSDARPRGPLDLSGPSARQAAGLAVNRVSTKRSGTQSRS